MNSTPPTRAELGTFRATARPAARLSVTLLLGALLLLANPVGGGTAIGQSAAAGSGAAVGSGVAAGQDTATGQEAALGQGAGAAQPGSTAGALRQEVNPAGGSLGASTVPWQAWGLRGMIALTLVPLGLWLVRRPSRVNNIHSPGFEVISPSEPRRFIPLEDRYQALDFLTDVNTRGGLRLSANLNKVSLSIRRHGYLMEDKNFRNALLVNRRRVRRTLLRDGDVLDLGDLTLLYRDNRIDAVVRHAAATPPDGKTQIRVDRLRGPVRRGMPMLVPDQAPNRVLYLAKNVIFIGRSETNDLVIKARNVYYRHAKIERVGNRYKLQDLSRLGSTFVNSRRIEQRFLREGDEIAIENHRFRFQFATRNLRDRPQLGEAQGGDDGADDPMGTEETGQSANDPRSGAHTRLPGRSA